MLIDMFIAAIQEGKDYYRLLKGEWGKIAVASRCSEPKDSGRTETTCTAKWGGLLIIANYSFIFSDPFDEIWSWKLKLR